MVNELMCCAQEVAFRSKIFDIHPLEATDSTRRSSIEQRIPCHEKMIKKFTRSSVDGTRFEIRSLRALKFTIYYLLNRIWLSDDVDSPAESYTFIMDRLRSVSVDITSSKISSSQPSLSREKISVLFDMLQLYVLMFKQCLSHRFTNPSDYGFDRSLHERQIANTISSILNDKRSFRMLHPNMVNYCLALSFSLHALESLREALCFSLILDASRPPIVKLGHLNSQLLMYVDDLTVLSSNSSGVSNKYCEYEMALKLLVHIRRGDPSACLQILRGRPRNSSISDYCENEDSSTGNIPPIDMEEENRVEIDAIGHIHSLISPWLSLWRLLLCNLCANKEEKTKLESMATRLHLSISAAEELAKFINIPIVNVDSEGNVSDQSKGHVIKMMVLKNSDQKSKLEDTIARLRNAINKSHNTLPDVLSRKILLLCNTGSEPSKFELKMTPEMLAQMGEFYESQERIKLAV